jgi:hypothetical protein
MKEYSTPDLSFAAFLLMKGIKLKFAEYDNHVRNLKRMIYSR